MNSLAFFLVISLPISLVLSQQQNPPSVASCGPLLLPLIPCAPYVQGTATSPTQPCCNSLSNLYTQQRGCICLLFNNTSNLSTFPINATLASQLPLLCNLQADNTAICSGESVTANPPAPENSSEPHHNSTVAASPIGALIPKTSILGYRRSEGTNLKLKSHFLLLIAAFIYM